MRKEQLVHDDVFVVHDFFSAEECQRFIALSESAGYGDAPITTSMGPVMAKNVRNNDRVMIDDPATAETLYLRLRPFLPDEFRSVRPCGLNERFRFYRYTKGQEFKWHYDGAYHRNETEVSEYTFMIYLNGGLAGGETKFCLKPQGRLPREEELMSVIPTAGKALLFRHDLLHTGAKVLDGIKYVMRTDVMFRA